MQVDARNDLALGRVRWASDVEVIVVAVGYRYIVAIIAVATRVFSIVEWRAG